VFSRILVANRGEIAVRIMRTCREMGIETIAVYSEADRAALHVRVAAASYCIGAAPARESYLNGAAIIRAALQSNAEAIHPGYGFLAENAAFAEEVVAAGLVWIGPPAYVIALLGDKIASKQVAAKAGVQIVPGYAGAVASYERLSAEADRIGYPIMLKAAAGGGGKGMRVIERAIDLNAGLDAVRREATSAFADDRVFMEKLLVRPRHVEMQVLADNRGDIVYLGERECSLQRRHQKVVEEAPSPVMTPTLRASMGDAAVRIARVTKYLNAGTVEFLLAGDEFYFLEVNTRIQVEHPVTEATSGLDLVRLQLQIAAGEPLPFSQVDIGVRGHAIEARLYAEDPDHQFLPSTGNLDVFAPPEGPGIRNDVGVERGDAISMHYDPMIAKLIVHAESRSAAVGRLQHALERYACAGPKTNLSFLQWLSLEPSFVQGDIDIGFLDRAWHPPEPQALPTPVLVAAALLDTAGAAPPNDPWRGRSNWRVSGIARCLRYLHAGRQYEVELLPLGQQSFRITIQDAPVTVWLVDVRSDLVVYEMNDSIMSASVARTGNGYSLVHGGTAYELQRPQLADASRSGAARQAIQADLTAPMPGTVVSVVVAEGQSVGAGEPLVIMEAMKMEHIVEAVSAGTVKAILVHPGEMVATGTVLVHMDA
jgi:3-methylcrotonyl-CoA carboxylase alpha subunit